MFHCELRGTTFSNVFSSIRVVLGTVSVRGSGCDAQVNVVEDPKGWSGTAPLIVSVCLPTFNLVIDGEKSTHISFGVYSTPAAAVLLGSTLGPALNLYTANVWDTSAVYITMNTPDYTQSSSTVTPPSPRASLVSVTINGSRVSTMSARWEPGINLKDAKVDHMQISHCVMQVEANGVKKNLVYPFPIDSTQTKIRIARKSGWIEVGFLHVVVYILTDSVSSLKPQFALPGRQLTGCFLLLSFTVGASLPGISIASI
jgi:hypothetical protein